MSTEPEFNPYAAPLADVNAVDPARRSDAEPQFLADRGTRFAGALIDNLLYGVSMLPGFLIGLSLDMKIEESAGLGMFTLLPFAIYQWYLVATRGQSLAKRWLKMRIVRADGSPPGFLYGVILRSWLPLGISAIPGVGRAFGFIDAVAIFSGDKRQCLHDLFAGTKVITVIS